MRYPYKHTFLSVRTMARTSPPRAIISNEDGVQGLLEIKDTQRPRAL